MQPGALKLKPDKTSQGCRPPRMKATLKGGEKGIVTEKGLGKKSKVSQYRLIGRGGKGVTGMETKEEDIVEDLFIASTHAYLMIFTDDGQVFKLKVHEIPQAGRAARGARERRPR